MNLETDHDHTLHDLDLGEINQTSSANSISPIEHFNKDEPLEEEFGYNKLD